MVGYLLALIFNLKCNDLCLLTLQDLLRSDFDWGSLFEPFDYCKRYSWFLKIYLSAWEKDDLGDWIGWVKSRFPRLILKVNE